ncbi:hypothetical protein J4405_00260 [Candidatus Woesearchaeota archaeon]|nr:hypothetical protein [Candidatus Woesearchaeota archaeon]
MIHSTDLQELRRRAVPESSLDERTRLILGEIRNEGFEAFLVLQKAGLIPGEFYEPTEVHDDFYQLILRIANPRYTVSFLVMDEEGNRILRSVTDPMHFHRVNGIPVAGNLNFDFEGNCFGGGYSPSEANQRVYRMPARNVA